MAAGREIPCVYGGHELLALEFTCQEFMNGIHAKTLRRTAARKTVHDLNGLSPWKELQKVRQVRRKGIVSHFDFN